MKKKPSHAEIEDMRRLEGRGVPVDWDAFYAPFNLTIFPVVSYGTDDEFLLDDFTMRIKELVFGAKFTCELAGILISLHLLKPEVPVAPDRMSWNSKGRRYRVQRTLDFDLWQFVNRRERKKMLAAAVIEILESIPVKRLSEPKREALVEIVRGAIRPKPKA
jgi:hypothetical protein